VIAENMTWIMAGSYGVRIVVMIGRIDGNDVSMKLVGMGVVLVVG
jgi:hypothetical protein